MPVRCAYPACKNESLKKDQLTTAATVAHKDVKTKNESLMKDQLTTAATAAHKDVKPENESLKKDQLTTAATAAHKDVKTGEGEVKDEPAAVAAAHKGVKTENESLKKDQLTTAAAAAHKDVKTGEGAKGVGKKRVRRCLGCYRVFYCGGECQVSDWERHRVDCMAWRLTSGVLASKRGAALTPLIRAYCRETVRGWFSGAFKGFTMLGQSDLIGSTAFAMFMLSAMEEYFNLTDRALISRKDEYVNTQFDAFKAALDGTLPCCLLPLLCTELVAIVKPMLGIAEGTQTSLSEPYQFPADQGYDKYMQAILAAIDAEWVKCGPAMVQAIVKTRDTCNNPNHHQYSQPRTASQKAFTLAPITTPPK